MSLPTGKLRKWLLTSLSQNRAIIHQQFRRSEVKQPLAKFFAIGCKCTFRKLPTTSIFGCFASEVNAPLTINSVLVKSVFTHRTNRNQQVKGCDRNLAPQQHAIVSHADYL